MVEKRRILALVYRLTEAEEMAKTTLLLIPFIHAVDMDTIEVVVLLAGPGD
jgi:hypothetical protein